MPQDAPRSTLHPLDPLTPEEITRAAGIVRCAHDLGAGMRFEAIELAEPQSEARKPAKGGTPAQRCAFVSTYDTVSSRLYEAIVSLEAGTVDSWIERPGARARIGPDEFLETERIALADPRFKAALARRGITDLSLVCADGWSAGSHMPGGEGRRLALTIVWVRNGKGDNQFAHPVEGLVGVIDINRGEVLSVEDTGPAEVPREPGNYDKSFQTTWRTGVKPIEVVQPEGPSFVVDGNAVEWCGWRFRVAFTAREGVVLHDLEIRDGERWRSVARRASIAEMVVPYGSPYGVHKRKNAFDCGEYGIGAMANSLTLGCDCLGAIHYFDGVLSGIDGKPSIIRNAICMHEEDTGILWKHTDFRSQMTDTRRNRRLVVSFIATVGNYEYMFYWHLGIDGSIALDVKATGLINTAGIDPPEARRYGTEVAPGVLGQIHQHIFCARLEMAIDGDANAVMEVDTELAPEGPDNPFGNAFFARETLLETELGAKRNADTARNRYWRVVNRRVKNRFGYTAGYRLMPSHTITALGGPKSQLGMRAGFTRHHLWVTPTAPDERWPAGDYVNQSEAGEGLPAWTQADRSIVDRPLTLWYVFGLHHLPRPEDYPIQPAVSCGFMLMPDGFFERNPTLDIPPAASSKSCCV